MLPQDASDCFYESCLYLSRIDLSDLSFGGGVMKEFVDKNLAPSFGTCRLVLPRVYLRPEGLSFIDGPNEDDEQVTYEGDAQQQLQSVFDVAQYALVQRFDVVDPQGILTDLASIDLFRKLTATLSVENVWLVNTDVSHLAPVDLHSLLLSFKSVGTIHSSSSTFAAAQLSDDLLQASAQRGVGLALSCSSPLPSGELCPATDDGILDFCFSTQYTFRRRYLSLFNVEISDEFLRRVTERLNEVTHLEHLWLKLWGVPRAQPRFEHYERIYRQNYVLHVNERTAGAYFMRIKYSEPRAPGLLPVFMLLVTTDSDEYHTQSPKNY